MLVASGTDGAVVSSIWCTTVPVGTLLWTEIDVIDATKLCELLVEEGPILEYDGLVDAGNGAKIHERVSEARFSCGQSCAQTQLSMSQEPDVDRARLPHVVSFPLPRNSPFLRKVALKLGLLLEGS